MTRCFNYMIVAMCVALISFTGCSSRMTVKEQRAENINLDSVYIYHCDTLMESDTLVIVATDTVTMVDKDNGRVEIHRDSLGRPILIVWDRNTRNFIGCRAFTS